jgi:hypothetical protein
MDSNEDEILLDIAHCSNVRQCLEEPGRMHPCRRIVLSQQSKLLKEHQVPEPWSGNISKARLLFLSSNPSISDTELYPRWSWPEEKMRDYFSERFGKWIRDGLYTLQQNGSYSKSVPFWREVRARAAELYERDVKPGLDYALTEVVHCKSRNNDGVALAVDECANLYLDRVLSVSAAKIIVTLGSVAARVMAEKYRMVSDSRLHGPINLGGRDRFVVFLAQPGSNRPRKFASCLSTDDLALLRAALRLGVQRTGM